MWWLAAPQSPMLIVLGNASDAECACMMTPPRLSLLRTAIRRGKEKKILQKVQDDTLNKEVNMQCRRADPHAENQIIDFDSKRGKHGSSTLTSLSKIPICEISL